MDTMTNFEQKAQPLLEIFQIKALHYFGCRVISLFKFGSLGAHGDFSLCSDVDVAIMLDHIQVDDDQKIQLLATELENSHLEYASRLSIFWSSYQENDYLNDNGRMPSLDRLDLIKNAILLYGNDQRTNLKLPTHIDVAISCAKFINVFLLTDEKLYELLSNRTSILEKGARYFSKFVLFPLRLVFTINHPGLVDSNQDAVNYFYNTWGKAQAPEVNELVNMAYAARGRHYKTIINVKSEILTGLLDLYVHCIREYIRYFKNNSSISDFSITEKLKNLLEKITDIESR